MKAVITIKGADMCGFVGFSLKQSSSKYFRVKVLQVESLFACFIRFSIMKPQGTDKNKMNNVRYEYLAS